jgi:hypothetical protein
MRSSLPLLALALWFVALAACEDGPTQTFVPSPAGAGSNWNDGKTPPAVGDAGQGYSSTNAGGTNAVNLCTGDELQKRWSVMVREPVVPPQFGAGLDMAGGESWQGLTITQAEKINCQATSVGDYFGDGNEDVSWGDNEEVVVEYLVNNLKIDEMTLNQGYLGAIGCTGMEPTPPDSPSQPTGIPCTPLQTSPMSKFGQHTYVIPINSQISKDGQPFSLDWVGAGGFNTDTSPGEGIIEEIDQLASAIFSTYFPGLPLIDNCDEAGFCIVNHFGEVPYVFIAPTGIGPLFASYLAGSQVASTPIQYQLYLTKIVPYSFNNPLLKMDAVGPTAAAPNASGILGVATSPCVLGMGLDYADFLANCVETTGDAMKDQVELNKILGGITHDNETWSFDVQGIDVNFASSSVADNAVVTDGMLPKPGDTTNYFDVDQSTVGTVLNDYSDALGQNIDLHGSGALYHEYARSVIQDLRAAACSSTSPPAWCGGATPNAACLTDTTTALASGSAPNLYAHLPGWCTGFEGMLTAASAATFTATASDPLAPGDVGLLALSIDGPYGLGMKPGAMQAAFCADANGDLTQATGYNLCGLGSDPGFGLAGNIFSTSFNRAVEVFGHGNVNTMPPQAQDRRFFFKEFMTAAVRYFTGPGIGATGPSYATMDPVPSLENVQIDLNNIYFDSIGAGQFEIAEYIDRRFASAAQAPLDIQITADVLNGIFNDWEFNRYLYRGESAFYGAMATNASDALGSEDTGLLTNAFGNPILLNWPGGATHSPYQCATDLSSATQADCAANGSGPPTDSVTGQILLDDNGLPLFTAYPGAIPSVASTTTPGTFTSQTLFTLTCTGGAVCGTGIRVAPLQDANANNFFQQATVSVPTFVNPYDPTSVPGPVIQKLLPFAPKQPGVGFNVPITGGTNYFIQANLIDFSGVTITSPLYYDCVIDPTTNLCKSDGSLQLEGVATADFLGKVFLCQEGADVLSAQMYTPVNEILTWIEQHPGAYAGNNDCQMVLRYSPFNNYLDDITSGANGVTVEVTQGGGYGRIVGATLFVPGQVGLGQ